MASLTKIYANFVVLHGYVFKARVGTNKYVDNLKYLHLVVSQPRPALKGMPKNYKKPLIVNCYWFTENADRFLEIFKVGDPVVVQGRLDYTEVLDENGKEKRKTIINCHTISNLVDMSNKDEINVLQNTYVNALVQQKLRDSFMTVKRVVKQRSEKDEE